MKNSKSIYDLYFKSATISEINIKFPKKIDNDDIGVLVNSYWKDFCKIIDNQESESYPFTVIGFELFRLYSNYSNNLNKNILQLVHKLLK